MTISRSLSQTRAGVAFKETKNETARIVALPPSALTALQAHKEARVIQTAVRRRVVGDLDLIFANPNGTLLKPESISSAVSLLFRRLKIQKPKGAALHLFRHPMARTCSQREWNFGLSRSGSDTVPVYSHRLTGRDKEAATRWDEFQRLHDQPGTSGKVRLYLHQGYKMKMGEGPMTTVTDPAERAVLIRHAFRLEWLTIAWMVIEGAVAIASGIIAHSLLLVAFGIDSAIELASACVLIWRLSLELRHGQAFSEATEHRASRIAGGLLFALALYVVVAAGIGLWQHHGAEFSTPGIVLAVVAMPIMYFLSRRKLAVAEQLGSRALRADAIESITCGWLSFVVVLGLVAQLVLGAWWVDSLASLAIVYFLIKEGREAWTGDECCDCSGTGL